MDVSRTATPDSLLNSDHVMLPSKDAKNILDKKNLGTFFKSVLRGVKGMSILTTNTSNDK